MQFSLVGKIVVRGVLSVAIAAASATALYAMEAGAGKQGATAQKDSAVGAGKSAEVRFIGNPGSPEKVKYLGSAPYICTPSGYGERAKCFLRPSGARARTR